MLSDRPGLVLFEVLSPTPSFLRAPQRFGMMHALTFLGTWMSIAESLRAQIVKDLFTMNSVTKCWPIWQELLRQRAGTPPEAGRLIEQLGTSLGAVFQSTNDSGRNQSSQSGGGAGWEALVCWYLNLGLIGTRAVVVKKTSQLPKPIRDALTVTYGTVRTNSESDLVGITFPKDDVLDRVDYRVVGKKKEELDSRISSLAGQLEVCVIQCKTNWNDNAQIPMLWDMIYSATGFAESRASVGVNGHSVQHLKSFAYALVTVPTQKDLTKFKVDSTPVLRLRNLSGGNYWGQPSKNGVAGSVGDIFNRLFATATQGVGRPWRSHLDAELAMLAKQYQYFDL